MASNTRMTAFQRQSYNKRHYVRRVVMETLEARLWESLRHYPKGSRAKFLVWQDPDDLSRFHIAISKEGHTKAPPMAWCVDLTFPEITSPSGEPRLGDPIITVWSLARSTPLVRLAGTTNRHLAEYACDAIIGDVLDATLGNLSLPPTG